MIFLDFPGSEQEAGAARDTKLLQIRDKRANSQHIR